MILVSSLLIMSPEVVIADKDSQGNNIGGWRIGGFDRLNSSDSSRISRVKKFNVNDLKLKWIYNFPVIPFSAVIPISNLMLPSGIGTNPINDPRNGFGASNSASVDRAGRVYVPTYDGHLMVLDGKTLQGTNPDNTAMPKVLMSLDFFGDPKYVTPNQTPGATVFFDRTFPTLIDNYVFAGNYGVGAAKAAYYDPSGATFSQRANDSPNPTNPGFINAGSVIYKLDRRTGNLVWKSVIDNNPFSSVGWTGITPVYGTAKGDLLIIPFGGSHSTAEGFMDATGATPLTDPFQGHCCDYRGGVAGVRMSDGAVVWKTYSMPKQQFPTLTEAQTLGHVDAWTSGSVWAPGNPPFSKKLNLVYVGTAELATVTKEANQCQLNLLNGGGALTDTSCLHYIQGQTTPSTTATFNDNVVESSATATTRVNSPTLPLGSAVIAMDAATGKIKWAKPLSGFDNWSPACITGANAPWFCASNVIGSIYGFFFQFTRDRDIGIPVLLENVKMADGTTHDVIVVSGKNSKIYGLDAATGQELWTPIEVGAGGLFGDGFIWGLATDGKRVYGNSGGSSDITYGDLTAPGNPKKLVMDGSCIKAGFGANPTPSSVWGVNPLDPFAGGGEYIAVDVPTGQVVWRRCGIGMLVDPVTKISTTNTPVADCSVANPPANCTASRINAGMSISNGVLIASGASEYVPNGIGALVIPEVLLLDADTGRVLRELPMSLLGQPVTNAVTNSRAISVGKNLYIMTGFHFPDQSVSDRAEFNSILMYTLSSDNDNYHDDRNDNDIGEDRN